MKNTHPLSTIIELEKESVTMAYLNATHAASEFTLTVTAGQARYSAERLIPCKFLYARRCLDSERIAYVYEDCATGSTFYTYEPLLPWGM